MEFDAGVMLDRIGDITGWRCLDLGCGAGGITNLLAQRVGPSGHVVGLDTEASALVAAQHWAASLGLEGIEYVEGNAYASELPRACFDLVHVRFVMGTAGEMDVLLKEMLALTRPGGVVAAQEPDIDALRCYPPHPAWTRLQTALGAAFLRLSYSTQAISAKQADSNKGLPCAASPPIGQHNPRKQT